MEEQGVLRQKTNEHRTTLTSDLADTERRIRKYEAAFEDANVDLSSLAPRIAELRSRQADIEETLSKVIPIHPHPSLLYTEESIGAFQNQVRELFTSGDNALTRSYLRFLVEKITITDRRIDVFARSEAAVMMIMTADDAMKSKSPAGFTSEALSPTCVSMWLRQHAPSENSATRVVIDLAAARKRLRSESLRPLKVVELLKLAERFQRLLDEGVVQRRADLARQFGISRARVTQLLHLLRLHPLIREYVRRLPPGTPAHAVSDRKLRAIAQLDSVGQLHAAKGLPGFTTSTASARRQRAGGKG